MRKPLVLAGVVLVLVAAVPIAVFAAGVRTSSQLDRQVAKSIQADATTSSASWRNVPGLARINACTIREVSATLSVTIQGAPALFRVVIDTPEGPMRPGAARFIPQGRETFSATFVRPTFPFEDDDTHSFSVQWRSPTGQPVTLRHGVVNLLFQRGTHNCP